MSSCKNEIIIYPKGTPSLFLIILKKLFNSKNVEFINYLLFTKKSYT